MNYDDAEMLACASGMQAALQELRHLRPEPPPVLPGQQPQEFEKFRRMVTSYWQNSRAAARFA